MLTAAIVKIHSGNYDTTTVYNLSLASLGLTDISQLGQLCPDLVTLDLTGNKLASLSGTESLNKLERLTLDRTSVPLSGIGKITSLQYLSLKECGISQINAIKPEEFTKLVNLRYLDLRQNPVSQQSNLSQFIRELLPSVRQLNGEFLLFPKFDNSAIQKPPTVSFAGPDTSINFDDVEQRLKKQMDEVTQSLKDCQQRLSEAEILVHRRLKEVKEYAESILAKEGI